VTVCQDVYLSSGHLFQWDDPHVNLHVASPLIIAVTPGTNRRVTTGSFHVALQLTPLLCEILPVVLQVASRESPKFSISSRASARLAHDLSNLAR
jgi:hypothetical protein